MNWKTALAGFSLGAAMLFAGAGTARADNCFERLQREQWQLRREISRHGFYSNQARHRRERIEQLRWQCNAFRNNDRRWDHGWRGRDRDWNRRWDRDRDHRWDNRWRRDRDHDGDRDRNHRSDNHRRRGFGWRR